MKQGDIARMQELIKEWVNMREVCEHRFYNGCRIKNHAGQIDTSICSMHTCKKGGKS